MNLIDQAAQVFLPSACLGCYRDDTELCEQCAQLFQVSPFDASALSSLLDGNMRLWSVQPYRGRGRKIILAAKHSRHIDFHRFLYAWGWSLGSKLASTWLPMRHYGDNPFTIIPAPSGWKRRLRRRLIVPHICEGVGAGFYATTSEAVEIVDLLRVKIGVRGQSGKNYWQRIEARRETMSCLGDLSGRDVVIIDDVVATGATLIEARRSIIEAAQSSVNVIGAGSLAVSIPHLFPGVN